MIMGSMPWILGCALAVLNDTSGLPLFEVFFHLVSWHVFKSHLTMVSVDRGHSRMHGLCRMTPAAWRFLR
jgi:hypothetical protein